MRTKDEALIVFSRLPIGRETKTRMAPLLDEHHRAQLHRCFWTDLFGTILELEARADPFLYWTGSGSLQGFSQLVPPSFRLRQQRGYDLGERMASAMNDVLSEGYKRAVIIGSDVPHVEPESIAKALNSLRDADVVLGATCDGGYWLIGANTTIPKLFDLPSFWGTKHVFGATQTRAQNLGYRCAETDSYGDLDTPQDLMAFYSARHPRGTATRAYLEAFFETAPPSRGRDRQRKPPDPGAET